MALAIIQLKTLIAGPDGVLQPGIPVEVEADFAHQLVALGYAEMLQDAPEEPKARKIERAVVAPPEDAAAGPSAKKR